MCPITVRPLAPADWKLCRELRLAALRDAPEAFGSTLAREESLTEEQWRRRLEGRSQFLAEEDGEPCGLAGVVPAGTGAAELVSVWVRPGTRGRGAADLLLRAALHWADEHGVTEVRLTVAAGNVTAERLYARHGFRRAATGERADEFVMVRTVPTAGPAG
ncbi:GNAT family N-acetyltransferase [Streptomyces sp. UNOC14_S4]|uniref:GNAT family N-acetyltransferase n=1 Tax=Streptomyces sp. UNOC14_S4 TaxID=2872340 RepID=UPI001E4DCC90|nr:GNAT family N-acetyltransferase [Streptomyces sp. UNOC14_S4]MCC3771942.1 GNAT family N-acetyltransferase [Streptomyces sp. UNOC14_S4]